MALIDVGRPEAAIAVRVDPRHPPAVRPRGRRGARLGQRALSRAPPAIIAGPGRTGGSAAHRADRLACRRVVSIRLPATHYPVERFTLANGLRVVLAPDRSAPVVGVAVVYDVGIRSEPEGRTGFAHLFEHLMFQGSENLEKLAHFRHVQGAGGTFNGSTHLDYTDYFETLPSNALERALFLEADRMRGPRLTEENLRNQVDVVKEEIRVNVLNRPYGGFPWLKLPPVMFDTFPNAHDGYGSFDDLESATVADAAEFFDALLRLRQRGARGRRRPRRRRGDRR